MTVVVWGRAAWTFLHWASVRLPETGVDEYKNLLASACQCLPCSICRGHALDYIQQHPLTCITTKHDAVVYTYDFHNAVNKQTSKAVFSTERFKNTYRYSIETAAPLRVPFKVV